MNQHQVYIYPLPLQPPSHAHLHATPPGDHRARSWAPRATQQLPNSRAILHTVVCTCQYLSIHLTPPSPSVSTSPKVPFLQSFFFRVDQCVRLVMVLAFVNRDLETTKNKTKQKEQRLFWYFLRKLKYSTFNNAY